MSKILYVIDKEDENTYQYNICEDTIIYHFSINSSAKVVINMVAEGVTLYYYYHNINYDDHSFHIQVNHQKSYTHSELYNHGVNVNDGKLDYYVEGIVPKKSIKCICNQENQIINMENGKSTIFPNLLIDNYDVDSNHSAYIGRFSLEKIFYMMSRGISREEANRLLLNGFLIPSDSIDLSQIQVFLDEIKKI
jgi:hypothetical protein